MKRTGLFLLLTMISIAVSAQVYVTKEVDQERKQITYHFKIVNPFHHQQCGIKSFLIGAYSVDENKYQFNSEGRKILIKSPTNWDDMINAKAESNSFMINWFVNKRDINDTSYDIPPNGRELDGFSITVPLDDTTPFDQARYVLFCRSAKEEPYKGRVILEQETK